MINAKRKKGESDKQIFEGLVRRKDGLGGNVRELVNRYEESESVDANEDTAKFFGLDITQVKGNSQQGSGNKNATALDKAKSYAVSAATGIGNVGAGLLQPIAIAGDTVNKGINKVLGTNLETDAESAVRRDNKALNATSDKYRLAANRKGFDAPKLVGEVGAQLPFFMYGAGGNTMAARVADQGARGALVGGLQLTQEGSNPNQRLYNMAGGAVGAAAGQAAGEVVSNVASKGIAKVTNAAKGRLQPKAQVIDDLGKQYGIRTSVGDIKGGGIIKNTETQLERIPLGMGKFRTAQHSEAKSASEKVLKQLKNIADDTDFKAIPQIEKAAQAGDKNARRILGIVNEAGDDSGKLLQASLEVQSWRKSAIATKLYNRVEQEVAKSGNDFVPPIKTRTAIVKELDKQAASISPNKVVVRELSEMLKNIDDVVKPKTFGNMRSLRSTQGNLAQEYGVGAGKGDAYASTVFGKVRSATEDDIASFATNSGNTAIKASYKKADKYYAGMMKGNDKAFTKAAQSTTPDEIYKKFIKSGKGDGAQNFYNALDPKGQAALRLQMAETAADKAWNANREAFSPAKFAGEFESLAEPYGRIFKGEDKAQMDGFVKLMRHVERAGQFKENPPTGVRLTDVGIVSVAMASPTSAAGGAGVTLLAKTLLTTRAGKNLLLAANKLPAGQQAALDNILKSAAKLAAAQGSKAGQEKASKVADTKIDKDNRGLAPSF
nr:hypothetical protein [Psychrobacter sp.]